MRWASHVPAFDDVWFLPFGDDKLVHKFITDIPHARTYRSEFNIALCDVLRSLVDYAVFSWSATDTEQSLIAVSVNIPMPVISPDDGEALWVPNNALNRSAVSCFFFHSSSCGPRPVSSAFGVKSLSAHTGIGAHFAPSHWLPFSRGRRQW